MRHERPAFLCLDMGTTRTRAWFEKDGKILARQSAGFGVRDLGPNRDQTAVRHRLAELLRDIEYSVRKQGWTESAQAILAAGMIGAPTGIREVPHIVAPAGADDLSRALVHMTAPEISRLPLYIVPGVRVPSPSLEVEDICTADLIRGEECLCIGMLALGRMHGGDMLLNLGSHWKWIALDAKGRIAGSRTSLTGEMIHSVQSHTLLASALPQHKAETLDRQWLRHGAEQVRREGLSRTLFCVRLLEMAGSSSPEERLAFVYGAHMEEEIRTLSLSAFYCGGSPKKILISGSPALARAWQEALLGIGWQSSVLAEEETESAYLCGLIGIAWSGITGKEKSAGERDENISVA
jgi:2-dehydro-3-deoxygalactonokinase